jgi:hypothetical protein
VEPTRRGGKDKKERFDQKRKEIEKEITRKLDSLRSFYLSSPLFYEIQKI